MSAPTDHGLLSTDVGLRVDGAFPTDDELVALVAAIAAVTATAAGAPDAEDSSESSPWVRHWREARRLPAPGAGAWREVDEL